MIRIRLPRCVALFPLLFLAGNGSAQFSIKQILSAPFPEALSAAPSRNRVAWVLNAEGVRNIWIAEGPSFRARRVTNFEKDDGQTISDLQWSPDSARIVFVRGDGPNRVGEVPNPTSDPKGAEQAIWALNVESGELKKLGEGSGPAVCPKDGRVVFVKQGQIFGAPPDGSKTSEQVVKARGRASALTWSPDGSHLAFVSDRGSHSFIGVWEGSSNTLRFPDPSVDRDLSPVWAPSGKRLAFLRVPAQNDRLPFFPRREAEPWSIRIADLESGAKMQVFRAVPGRGSAFWPVTGASQIFWMQDGRIVFPWEETGWNLLFAVPAAGGSPQLLTPGEFEVEDVSLTSDGKTLVFSSNQSDIERRHLYRAGAGDSAAQPLTRGREIEWSPVVLSDRKTVAFLRSSATRPAHAAIRLPDGSVRELDPTAIAADFPSARLVEPQSVKFPATDGMEIPAQLFLPRGYESGRRYPAVIFFHGGSRRQMLLGFHYRGYYHNAYALNQYFASRGYVVMSVNYRSGTGYGMVFREALRYGAQGGSEFQDVLGAGMYLRSRADVDPARIGLWGGSYGGYLTAMGLARASDLFAAGVDIHGVHDWNEGIRNFVPGYNAREEEERARVAFDSSPMARVKDWKSPVLLIHGDDDRNVMFTETVRLVEELRKLGIHHEILVFPDEIHGFLLHANWRRAYEAAADFFERKLKGKKE